MERALAAGPIVALVGCAQVVPPPPSPAPLPSAVPSATVDWMAAPRTGETRLPPQPPPPPTIYEPLIFYASGAIEPSAESLRGMAFWVGYMRQPGVTAIILTTHTDTVGPRAANQRLSERRLRWLVNWFVAHGVPGDLITGRARGETENAVATGDGVAEPINRRATVNVNF